MPIFEYECDCGNRQERLCRNGEDAPVCCGEPMKKIISAPGRLLFKGEGFYATEYGDQAYGLNADERRNRSNRELRNRGFPTI